MHLVEICSWRGWPHRRASQAGVLRSQLLLLFTLAPAPEPGHASDPRVAVDETAECQLGSIPPGSSVARTRVLLDRAQSGVPAIHSTREA